MHLRRNARRLTSWIAVLAVLMAALAPSISHALAAKGASSWIEVCSSEGAKWARSDSASTEEAPAPSAVHLFEHCPYCSPHASAIAICAAAMARVAVGVPASDLPIASMPAPHVLFTWVSAQPRAPPLVS